MPDTTVENRKRKVRIVLGTGGSRILSAVGVLSELEREGYEINSTAGCSAGTLIAALIAGGKTSEQIIEFFMLLNVSKAAGSVSLPWNLLWGDCSQYRYSRFPDAVCDAIGGNPRLVDLKLPFFSSVVDIFNLTVYSYSNQDEKTKETYLHKVLSEAIAVPGLYPTPVREGRMLIDGAFATQINLAMSTPFEIGEVIVVVTCHVPRITKKPTNLQSLLERTIEASIAINDQFVLETVTKIGGMEYDVVQNSITTRKRMPYVHWVNVVCESNIGYKQFDLNSAQKVSLFEAGRRAIIANPIPESFFSDQSSQLSSSEQLHKHSPFFALFVNNFVNRLQGDLNTMGDENNVYGGQVGAMGNQAHTHDATFNQTVNQNTINLDALAVELSRLRQAAKKEAEGVEHDMAVGYIAAAEVAAREGDEPKALENLRAAGKWSFDVATKVGTSLIVEILKKLLPL